MYPEKPVNPITGVVLDLATQENYRIINVFIGIWLAIFSIPTFLYVKDKKKKKKLSLNPISNSFKNVKQTFNQIRKCIN